MVAKSFRFTLLASWLFACFLSFTTVLLWDEQLPLPANAGVVVTEWAEQKPASAVRADIEKFAAEHRITVGMTRADFRQRTSGRVLYLAGGDPAVPAADWLRGGYQDFSRSMSTQVRPFTELGALDPIGTYLVFGDPAKATELARYFGEQGMEVSDGFDRWGRSPFALLPDGQLTALGMMLLVAVSVAAASVLVSARSYGVQQLQGLGYGALLWHDLRTAALPWLLSGALALAGATGALAFYNGLAGIGAYLVTSVLLAALLTAATVASHAVVLALLVQLPVLSAVKGELPARSASVIAFGLRIVTVATTVVLVQQVIATGMDVERRTEVLATYAKAGDTSTVDLGEVWSGKDEQALEKVVGPWLRAEDNAGHVLLAGRKFIQETGPLRGEELVYVNETFLREQGVRLTDGTEFRAGDGPVVLLPPALWPHRDLVLKMIAERSPELHKDVAAFRPAESAAGQRFFTYTPRGTGFRNTGGTGAAAADESVLTDPIVVFLPSRQGLLRESTYTAFASQGRLFFPDPKIVAAAVAADPALAEFVQAATPVGDHATAQYREVAGQFRLALLGALAGALVLLITGVGTVLIHSRRNAQWIFARHVSGWRFGAVHRTLLSFEAIVLVVLLAWLPYQAWRVNADIAQYTSRGIPAPVEPMVLGAPEWLATGLLAALTAGGALIALTRAHHRVVRDGASEA